MRVAVVDLPAYTPPYDRSLCGALARAGADVTLLTSRFAHGEVPRFDLVHYQWLTFPGFDAWLLPPARPRVLTPHGWLRAEGDAARGAAGFRRLARKMDLVVALSEWGARRLRDDLGVDPRRVEVVPHGAFDYLTRLRDEAPLPPSLA